MASSLAKEITDALHDLQAPAVLDQLKVGLAGRSRAPSCLTLVADPKSRSLHANRDIARIVLLRGTPQELAGASPCQARITNNR